MYGISYKKLKKIKVSTNLGGSNLFFIKAKVFDKPGSIAAITTILKNFKISIKSLFQEQINKNSFNVVILTHKCEQKTIDKATSKLNKCNYLKEDSIIIQVLHV